MLRLLTILVSLCLAVLPAQAWGPDGHRIVGLVAAKHLEKAIAIKVRKLLSGQSMASVANYGDTYRESHSETALWHYVDIPYTATKYRASRDCVDTDANGSKDCVIAAIADQASILGAADTAPADRVLALKLLIHFVGDIHQPFHDIERTVNGVPDQGGKVKVTLFDKKMFLHGVWDSGLIANAGLSNTAYARELEKDVVPGLLKKLGGTTVSWSESAHAIAKSAYVSDGAELADDYYNDHIGEVDEQLSLAGLRLAAILNATLADVEVE